MRVFKFGGASLKDPRSIRNMLEIVRKYGQPPLLIVVSAMGKTTNALEQVIDHHRKTGVPGPAFKSLRQYHVGIMQELFKPGDDAFDAVELLFERALQALQDPLPYDTIYDQVIAYGELISSTIVHHLALQEGLPAVWMDARSFISTDETFRESKVDWDLTRKKVSELRPVLADKIVLTQGFIGKAASGLTTTLGREGSDYSAAIFASLLDARSVTIWKDVPGVMSADPKRSPDPVVSSELPYQEAAEMTYYGISVIHPKTIKPLATAGIPLFVKSFDNPELPGTVIHQCRIPHLPPLVVFKENQCLVSCKVTDYTFISEHQISMIFHQLSSLDIHINVMQNSAISFSFCIDFRESRVSALIRELQKKFEVYYNAGLTLITVRNYDTASFEKYRKLDGVLLEQVSRSTLQVLVKGKPNPLP